MNELSEFFKKCNFNVKTDIFFYRFFGIVKTKIDKTPYAYIVSKQVSTANASFKSSCSNQHNVTMIYAMKNMIATNTFCGCAARTNETWVNLL